MCVCVYYAMISAARLTIIAIISYSQYLGFLSPSCCPSMHLLLSLILPRHNGLWSFIYNNFSTSSCQVLLWLLRQTPLWSLLTQVNTFSSCSKNELWNINLITVYLMREVSMTSDNTQYVSKAIPYHATSKVFHGLIDLYDTQD